MQEKNQVVCTLCASIWNENTNCADLQISTDKSAPDIDYNTNCDDKYMSQCCNDIDYNSNCDNKYMSQCCDDIDYNTF